MVGENMALYPVILCGGAGTRLWPASRADRPKQFLPLVGARSSFQQTLLRLADLHPAEIIIVSGLAHSDLVREQVGGLGLTATVIIEPEARDSAPAVAAAAAYVQAKAPDAVVLMLAADHHVRDVPRFVAAARLGMAAAQSGYIATFGMTPDHPATGYGYIQPGSEVLPGTFKVAAFVEKPPLDLAKAYLAKGYVWNSGNFAFLAKTLMDEFDALDPATARAARASVEGARHQDDQVFLDAKAFAQTTRKSLDYAIMEKTQKAAVVPASFGWSDLGSWDAIWQASAHNGDGNAIMGDVQCLDSRNTLVRANGMFVGVVGVDDLAIIAEGDAVLVCRRQDSQKVKALVDALTAQGRSMVRQQGSGQTLLHGGGVCVTRLERAPGQGGQIPAGAYQVLQGAIELESGQVLVAAAQGQCDQTMAFTTKTGCLILLTQWS
jgi:mannose-1-phosphate guanylyltransferase